MSCSLVGEDEGIPQGPLGAALAGTLVSSLHRLKDSDNLDGAFFVFGDLSVKLEGTFRLQFNLYEMRQNECYHIKAILSNSFPVHSTKNFQGMSESTFLTRSFSDQGVRLRLRKEPRTLLRKRGPAHDDYQPRHYRTSNRQSSQGVERQVTSPESQDAVRQGQNEQGDFVESPQGLSGYDQRPPMGRRFSQQSTSSYQGLSYDESNKRPRTGSEHGQTPTFNQQQPLDSPQYRGVYPDPQQSPFSSFSPQGGQAGSFSYAYSSPPHSSALAARDQYFSQRVRTHTGTTSPYDQPQRSPQYQTFPPQPQAIHYQPSPRQQYDGAMMAPSPPPPRLDIALGSLENLGLRGPISPIGAPPALGMGPPTYGRIATNMPYLPSSGRRDSYPAGFQSPNPNVNLSAGSMAGIPGMYVTRSPAVTTSGSGGLEGRY
jgi:Velvet factor